MANGHWTNGAADRDIGTAGNWSGGATPGANESAYFIADVANTNSQYPNTGMADLTAIDLNLLQILDGYAQPIGGSSNHFTITADKIVHNGSGTLWWKDGTAAAVSDALVVETGRGNPVSESIIHCQIGNAATLSDLFALRGKAVVESGSTVTNITVGRLNHTILDAFCTIDAGATISTLVEVMGGLLRSDSAIPTLKAFGGTTWQGTAAFTTLYVFPGARVNLTFGGTVATTVHHFGGVIDGTKGGGLKTIGTYFRYFNNEDENNVMVGDQGIITCTARQ